MIMEQQQLCDMNSSVPIREMIDSMFKSTHRFIYLALELMMPFIRSVGIVDISSKTFMNEFECRLSKHMWLGATATDYSAT